MAKKKIAEPEDRLTTVAEAVGTALGKLAAKMGLGDDAPAPTRGQDRYLRAMTKRVDEAEQEAAKAKRKAPAKKKAAPKKVVAKKAPAKRAVVKKSLAKKA